MSTVHETTTAKHCGLRVFAFSLITNKCSTKGIMKQFDTSADKSDLAEEVFEVTRQAEPMLQDFVRRLIPAFKQGCVS